MASKREFGAEQPSSAGVLKLRLPFVHYRLEYQDFIQGAILSCVPLGITAAMTSVLGIPLEIAVLMVVINNFLYLLHTSFGDPSVAGWITAGIPLYIAYLTGYAEGPERIQALIALQILVGLIFLVMGVTGIAKTVISKFPISMRAGILLGAGFASLMRIFDPGQPFISQMPIAFLTASFFSFFVLFSIRALAYRARYGWFAWIAGFGIAPGFVIGYIVGLMTGEIRHAQGCVRPVHHRHSARRDVHRFQCHQYRHAFIRHVGRGPFAGCGGLRVGVRRHPGIGSAHPGCGQQSQG
jgi:hypothetical protein